MISLYYLDSWIINFAVCIKCCNPLYEKIKNRKVIHVEYRITVVHPTRTDFSMFVRLEKVTVQKKEKKSWDAPYDMMVTLYVT